MKILYCNKYNFPFSGTEVYLFDLMRLMEEQGHEVALFMLFVLPSDQEGLSLALLEAMGAGLCVLASDIPENRELVDGAGFLFKAGNVVDLERMLRLLISDSSARAWAGERAKRRIRQHYLWPDITTQVEAVSLDVLGWKKKDAVDSGVPCVTPPPSKPVASEHPVQSLPRIRRVG